MGGWKLETTFAAGENWLGTSKLTAAAATDWSGLAASEKRFAIVRGSLARAADCDDWKASAGAATNELRLVTDAFCVATVAGFAGAGSAKNGFFTRLRRASWAESCDVVGARWDGASGLNDWNSLILEGLKLNSFCWFVNCRANAALLLSSTPFTDDDKPATMRR